MKTLLAAPALAFTLALLAGASTPTFAQEANMNNKPAKTLRLVMPEWQGGDYDTKPPTRLMYPLGARLLAFLAPESDTAVTVEVPLVPWNGEERAKTNGVVWQENVLANLRAAKKLIAEHAPDRIVTFGGECLVNQAPFDYLNGRYKGDLAILWIDAHPDISTPKNHDREHAMILGNLLGGGDPVFAKAVDNPFKPNQALLVGVDRFESQAEEAIVKELGLARVLPKEIAETSEPVLRWIRDSGFKHVVIHFDLDVLDPKLFYSVLLNAPGSEPFDTPAGQFTVAQIVRLFKDVSAAVDVVGVGFAEHMPWDALGLQQMMEALPIMR